MHFYAGDIYSVAQGIPEVVGDQVAVFHGQRTRRIRWFTCIVYTTFSKVDEHSKHNAAGGALAAVYKV